MTMAVEKAVEKSSETPSAVIDRISLVLDSFDGPGRLTLAQIVRRTGLPRSSAHRMLERLVALRWLRRDGRDYELGMRLVELGSLALHQDRIHRAAIPLLRDLHRATGLVVHLAVLDGSDVVYLEKIGEQMGQRSRPGSAGVSRPTARRSVKPSSPTRTSPTSTCPGARPGFRSPPLRSWPPRWRRSVRTEWPSNARSRCPASAAWPHPSARTVTRWQRSRCADR